MCLKINLGQLKKSGITIYFKPALPHCTCFDWNIFFSNSTDKQLAVKCINYSREANEECFRKRLKYLCTFFFRIILVPLKETKRKLMQIDLLAECFSGKFLLETWKRNILSYLPNLLSAFIRFKNLG